MSAVFMEVGRWSPFNWNGFENWASIHIVVAVNRVFHGRSSLGVLFFLSLFTFFDAFNFRKDLIDDFKLLHFFKLFSQCKDLRYLTFR